MIKNGKQVRKIVMLLKVNKNHFILMLNVFATFS